jgi:serine protease Do/serine protease DegQ
MRRSLVPVLVLLALVQAPPVRADALPAAPASPAADEAAPVPTLAPLLKRVLPAVVNIAVSGKVAVQQNPILQDPFFRHFFGIPDQPVSREFHAAGSGVIVDPARGYVITNNHVVQHADKITVQLRDGRRLDAKLVGSDPEVDVAVLRVKPDGLMGIDLGDSRQLQVGDYVVAIGNPFGLGQTATLGIVSAVGRSGLGIEGYEDFIQTDASINPGNSGGALVDLHGRLVGINTAIVGPSGGSVGIGFAIPIDMAREVMDQLIRYGEVRRGRLGVEVQELTPELAKGLGVSAERGAVVTRVLKGSPAAEAGLQSGDVVTAVNGQPVQSAADLRNQIGLRRAGETVKLEVVRAGKTREIDARITAVKLARAKGASLHAALAGATLGDQGEVGARGVKGVKVIDVAPGSPAWEEGLRAGDVITSVDREPVESLSDLEHLVRKGQRPLLLEIARGDESLFLSIG